MEKKLVLVMRVFVGFLAKLVWLAREIAGHLEKMTVAEGELFALWLHHQLLYPKVEVE